MLLYVVPAKRADLETIPVIGGESSVQARSDRAAIELVIAILQDCVYPPKSYAGGFTDLGCGLDGLHLTWRRDILSEADSAGVISLDGLRRIRSKLSQAITASGTPAPVILLDANRKIKSPARDDGGSTANERRYKLIEIIEHALSLRSTIECIPSQVREERISTAYRTEPQAPTARPVSKVVVSKGSPTDRTPFDNPQTYSVPKRI
jgi:hypothetical protein